MKLDKITTIRGSTVYGVTEEGERELLTENASVTLPAVAFASTEVQTYGTTSVCDYSLPEAMEATVVFHGVDSKMPTGAGCKQLEVRWNETVLRTDRTTGKVSCKAFLTGRMKSLPSISVAVPEVGDLEVVYDVFRYELVVDGEQKVIIDKIAGRTMIDGVDYGDSGDDL